MKKLRQIKKLKQWLNNFLMEYQIDIAMKLGRPLRKNTAAKFRLATSVNLKKEPNKWILCFGHLDSKVQHYLEYEGCLVTENGAIYVGTKQTPYMMTQPNEAFAMEVHKIIRTRRFAFEEVV